MELSVCVDAVYYNQNWVKELENLKHEGFSEIEFWSWWDKDLDVLQKEKDRLGIKIRTFCTRFISLTDPDYIDDYIQGLEESIEAAEKLGCTMLISQVGSDNGLPRQQQFNSIVSGLKKCVPLLAKSGVTLIIEPLNTKIDHPGYFLSSSKETFDLVREINSDYVKVLFDIYHQQITEGDVLRNIKENLSLIGHFHAAGNPGRNEITNGELNYTNILREINKLGYTGSVGLEYFTTKPPLEGLKQAQLILEQSRK